MTTDKEFDEPTLTEEFCVRPAEHEIFLSFVNDEDAEIFSYFWSEIGLNQFKEYWIKYQEE